MLKGAVDAYFFMPSELFSWLLGGVHHDVNFAEGTRSMVADDLKPFGYHEEQFWTTIRTVAKTYSSLAEKQEGLAQQLAGADPQKQSSLRAEMDRNGKALCRARADALSAARAALGRTWLHVRVREALYRKRRDRCALERPVLLRRVVRLRL